MAGHRRCYSAPATIPAMCGDCRAGASFDLALDVADRTAGHRISCGRSCAAFLADEVRAGSPARSVVKKSL